MAQMHNQNGRRIVGKSLQHKENQVSGTAEFALPAFFLIRHFV